MSITNRLLAPIGRVDRQNKPVAFDLGAFVRRLLLFDTYILHTGSLEDMTPLARTFGERGVEQLLSSGALKLHCGVFAIGQTGQVRADLNLNGKNNRLPLGSYSFSSIRVQNREEKIERSLAPFGRSLQDEARKNLVAIPESFFSDTFEGFYSDIRTSSTTLEAVIRNRLQKLGVKPKRIKLTVEEIEPEDFRVESNLCEEYGLSSKDSHKLIEGALLAVGSLNQRLAEMMAFSALSGAGDEDLPLLQGKLSLVASLVSSANHEPQFTRVIEIAGLPEPQIGETRIEAEQLLGLRDSEDCRAFRDWLSRTNSISDEDLARRLKGFSARVREALGCKFAKAVRFVVSNGLGILGPAPGLAASAVDTFLLDRLVPRDAVVAFLSESYQPLFRKAL